MNRLRAIIFLLFCLAAPAAAQFDHPPDQSFLWNRFNSVLVRSNYAIAAVRYGLIPLRYSREQQTYFSSGYNFQFLPSEPMDYKEYGDTVVYRSRGDQLFIVDVSKLPELSLIHTLTPPSGFVDYAVDGEYLYLARGFEGVSRYRINISGDQSFVDSSMIGVHCIQVEVSDDNLYVLDDYNGILRYDLAGTGFGLFREYLYLPLQASSFLMRDSQVVVSLWNRPDLLLATFGNSNASIFDTISTIGVPVRLTRYDNLVIIMNRNVAVIERLNLNDRSIERAVYDAFLQPDHFGDISERDGHIYYLSARRFGGLAEFRIDGVQPDGNADNPYKHPGPITALTFQNGRLVTAGLKNPVELYVPRIEYPPYLDRTLISGLAGVTSVLSVEDRLMVYYTPLNSMYIFQLTPDDVFVRNIIPIDRTLGEKFRFKPQFASEPEALMTWGASQGHIFSIPDSGRTGVQVTISIGGGITDGIFFDSLVVLANSKKNLWIYRLYDNFDVEFRATIGTRGRVSHMVRLDSDLFGPRLLVFTGAEMLLLNLDDPFSPTIDTSEFLPFGVNESAFANDKMYTIAVEGIAEFRLSDSSLLPELMNWGGRGGNLITAIDNVLATSDGTVINLYQIHSTIVSVLQPDEPNRNSLTSFNYPNPFNPATTIEYNLPSSGSVRLELFNMLGQHVRTLAQGEQQAGEHHLTWDGTDQNGQQVASGIYFYRLTFNDLIESRKMILLR